MRARMLTLLVAIAIGGLSGAGAQDTPVDFYKAIVDQYRSDPDRAVEQATALSPAAFTTSPDLAAADASGPTSAYLRAAMLMHLETALVLAKRKDARAGAHIRAGQDLGWALRGRPDDAWFVHQWHTIVTHVFTRSALLNSVRQRALPWNEQIASFENGLRLENESMKPASVFPGLEVRVYDAPELRRALTYLEPAAAAGVLVAAVHAGRLRMLRGDGALARQHFEQATSASTPSTRYLAHLFLGSMDERDRDVGSAERHYLAAASVFPYAQSGRLALGALLARSGRSKEAAAVVGRTPPGNVERLLFDPWWLYMPPDPFEPAATLTGMYAEVQK